MIQLRELQGRELHELAGQYGVTICREDKVSEVWADHVFERHSQLPPNASQSPDSGSWKLESIPLKHSGWQTDIQRNNGDRHDRSSE